ncbi:hypothetical protein LOZ57_006652 [Ophidiomyces ophidiicola]|uniref:uncharacterized protein n=1 Tax=Ophidiomyces ophidiicola TaxID=1387563 RepID=UPI0020C2ADA3|nr:uncharacterized protein LOZ57_006652 [Ophidiomyces ophidiicola]KAI1937078.1 hypothetical protein LOZ57_006652 [Ophidiomyces ophidiicola]KAI2045394.1 hypothetical protein LOZ43_006098 [Ophidiomyces ophidiicola]
MADDEEYFLPLEDQSIFGAGIKRKRVLFVRPTDAPSAPDNDSLFAPVTASSTPGPRSADSGSGTLGEEYLSIVLSRSSSSAPATAPDRSTPPQIPSTTAPEDPSRRLCDICNLPLSQLPPAVSDRRYPPHPHESSLVHQVSLPHSHPPSAIDRTRHGYKYLSSYGWDPDARVGLGPNGSGIRVPIKAEFKRDTTGLGVDVKRLTDLEKQERENRRTIGKLNAKQVKQKDAEEKRKSDKLRELFYASEDVEKYLSGA